MSHLLTIALGALAVIAVQRGWRRVIVALLSRGDT
jgi:hypothetical protein